METIEESKANYIKDVATHLLCAFVWEKTPQGFDYWKEVYHALNELSQMKGGSKD